LFTVELQKRLRSVGVDSFSLHPGCIVTELQRHTGISGLFIVPLMHLLGKNAVQGAQTSIFAAVSPSLSGKGGSYLKDCQITMPIFQSRDPDAARKLWEVSSKLVGLPVEL